MRRVLRRENSRPFDCANAHVVIAQKTHPVKARMIGHCLPAINPQTPSTTNNVIVLSDKMNKGM